MELRQLTTQSQRELFRSGMLEARAAKGGKFKESRRSRVSEIHITFGRVFGIFDDQGRDPQRLLGGFTMHSLDEFGQSHPLPNLTHLPAGAVFEAGQLWSFNTEAALSLRYGCMILLGLFQVQAFLIYPIIGPRDQSVFYRSFKRIGPPFELPFAETASGDKIWVQAMLLEGEALRRQVELACESGFETRQGHRLLRFDGPLARVNRTAEVSEPTLDSSNQEKSRANGAG